MVLSSSQQVVFAFTAVLFAFVVFPRMFGVGSGAKETRGFDARYNRKAGPGPGPAAVRGQPVHISSAGDMNKAQTVENMQQMKMMMEQEMKGDKYKTNSNKGYVFTLMPLYAIGVGLFAAYKFLKIKSADDSQAQKNVATKGAKKSEETENQLNELEQRLAQTEKMLNSILTQLDPLTSCVKSVAQEQKNEIMSQLQSIRHLMKKRGMDCPPLNIEEPQCEQNLDDLIESLAARDDTRPEVATCAAGGQGDVGKGEEPELGHRPRHRSKSKDTSAVTGDGGARLRHTEAEEEEGGDEDDSELMPSLEDCDETNIEDIVVGESFPEEIPATGLRRRNRLE
ncbi:coiled-coil domain-containing protein 107 [Esox lucius]|uniref:Resistance to inhibitors of cholinesterase protein 3 N-terminal domain-containing protein n=2 Tax=Esox lucius TaxID=8010 RepID=A0AAY5KJM8_ESOLU|nr:coiled-coil domain-containing protein 107 [Esox lucius]